MSEPTMGPNTTTDPRPAIVRFVDNWNRAAARLAEPSQAESRWPAAVAVDHRPPNMGGQDRRRLDAAARRALRVYPGPVGELIRREIQASLDFGYRLEGCGLAKRLADQILASDAQSGRARARGATAPIE